MSYAEDLMVAMLRRQIWEYEHGVPFDPIAYMLELLDEADRDE